ncbi:hypothetical protein ATEIFO6365_0008000400 [Aspergillus terreus]|uniref:Uncharacterized protein n=1 Tax=Aspergillus terreus TaxID=33178 RepID=A0A5M3Z919_ASPTE|nr:hypothetical protein ATETN484_0010001300 [Aspergillus terreus]GFF18063.1 hypothetical protein ATEIFO6365_0008000400 [Aspergillus terreus]
MASWDSFSAFSGKLNPSLLKPALDSAGNVDYPAAVRRFSQWIRDLRQSPADYGIPLERIKDVQKVLDVFLPVPAEGQPVQPRRINSHQGFPASLRQIVPVEVQFGPQNATLPIVDAPSALGYVFSFATPLPGAEKLTFDGYYLPLSCFASARYGLALTQPTQKALKHLIIPLFARNPTVQMPDWTPTVRRTAARLLNEYILGKKGSDSTATPFLDSLFTGVLPKLPGLGDNAGLAEYLEAVSLLVKVDAKQPLGVSTAPDFLIAQVKLSSQLMGLLYALVDSLTNLEDIPKLFQDIQALVRFYVTPHVFDPITDQELPLGEQSSPVVETLMAALPALVLEPMRKKLKSLYCHLYSLYESTDDQIRYVERSYFIDQRKSYARATEALPIFVLS